MKQVIILFFCLILGGYQLILSQPLYTFKRLTVADGLVSNYIVDIIQDKQGYIWMASESGLCKFDGKISQHTTQAIQTSKVMHTTYYITMKKTTQYG